jgi:hypothetical protein
MGKNCFDSPNNLWLSKDNPASQSSMRTISPWRFLLTISDEDLRHPETLKNHVPLDWSWLKISDEDLRQENPPQVIIRDASEPHSTQNFDYWIPKIDNSQNNSSDAYLIIQNTSQRWIVWILAISDEDLRHPVIPESATPQDWSWLKISDEDLR